MAILCLDLGTRCGWALSIGGTILSGVQEFKTGRHTGAGMQFVRMRIWLDEMMQASPITELYYEEVRGHAGVDAAHHYGAFWGTLTAWCQERQVPFEGIPVGTIKRHAGKGNFSKAQMLEAAKAKGWTCTDDNEVDARWLLDYVLAERVGVKP